MILYEMKNEVNERDFHREREMKKVSPLNQAVVCCCKTVLFFLLGGNALSSALQTAISSVSEWCLKHTNDANAKRAEISSTGTKMFRCNGTICLTKYSGTSI